MIIPAFPMKSPNRTAKVLSTLPDLGEELALHHLNGLCSNIQDIYPPGAEVRVQSDGLVYSDLLGVSDGDVFDYGEALRDMARTSNLSHLKFSRVSELLGYSDLDLEDKDDVKVRRARYLDQVSKVREDLLEKYKDPDLDIKVAIRGEEDTRLTYCGYLKFLATDLVDDPRVVEARKVSNKAVDRLVAQVAREMLVRGKAFAEAIRERLPGVLRLSIHEGVGSSKISVGLIPVPRREVLDANSGSDGEGDSECICSGVVEKVKLKKGARLGPTPWHSVIAVGLDGSYRSLPAQEVKPTHDLIYQHGRPYYYREKSDLFNWPFPVTFSPQYPCGLIISPDLAPNTDASSTSSPASPSPSLAQIPMSKVRALATTFSPIILRGFQDTLQEDLFVSKAEEMGTICPWNFGIIQKVKDLGQEKNETTSNVTTNEAMPFHYDGVFKFENRTLPDGTTSRVSCPPLYQLFTCHANTVPRGQGTTLFASSRLLLQYFPPHYPLSRLRDVTWTLRSQGFWSATLENLNLIVDHPVDNQPCLRWHEPWDSTQSHIATSTVKIENDEQDVSDQIKRLIYDRRICVYFTWEKGDALVNDNFAMHHTRTRYDVGWERELWRIHVD
jgi:pyoverdine/dityrosine biosynthesis protein Dit1/alpha-ketoglutarate-dependent taurine dioxygenase